MLNNHVPQRQMLLWLIASASAPLAIYAGSASWEWTLAVGIVCTLAAVIVLEFGRADYGAVLRVVQTGAIAVVAGTLVKDIAPCWGSQDQMIPLTLIVLAVLSAINGPEQASRVSCVTTWIIALLYIVVLAAGVKNLDISRVASDGKGNGLLVTVFLLPAVSLLISPVRGKRTRLLLCIPVFATIISLWCAGTLSRQAAMAVDVPFYEYSKSLNLLGVAERFESLASVAVTLGVFCMLSLFMSAAGNMINNGEIFAGIGTAVTFYLDLGAVEVSVLAVILWVILPLINSVIKNRKNVKKVLDKWG